MRNKLTRDVRRPIPMPAQAHASSVDMVIDDEFKDIINRECPGKLLKLMRQRVSKRVNTQPIIGIDPQDTRQFKVFERTFFKERQKSAERDRRAQSMRASLQQRLRLNQRPPSPFFKLSRASIIGLQRSSLQLDSPRRYEDSHRSESIRAILHPYIRISERANHDVAKQLHTKASWQSSSYMQFKPFGDVEPVQLGP